MNSLLAQTYKIKLIFYDNCSTDKSKSIIKIIKIKEYIILDQIKYNWD